MAGVVENLCIRLMRERNYVYETSSSSDDEWEAVLQQRGKRKLRPRIRGYGDVVHSYMDHEFKSHFRMSRETFEFLLGIIGPDLIRKVKGCETIPSRIQLMIALWKMATMDSYRSVCDRFNVGRATALRSVRRVTNAIFKLTTRFIEWPSEDRAVIIMEGFAEASGFPQIIGAIDGTHIRIDAPKENPADYICRKGFHSIQLQVVCDHRALITHCYTGHPGSLHDQRVFRQSEVSEYLKYDEKFPSESHLVGDAAYELHRHLLVPFKDNGHLTARQINYNFRHSSARIVVERCIGLLKGRMRSLLHCLPMRRVDLMAKYIIACCIIHNICILRGDELQVISVVQAEDDLQLVNPGIQRDEARTTAILKRNRIMETLANA